VTASVTVIQLDNNKFGDKGATTLADALKVNTLVTAILLSGNLVFKKGNAALVDALQVNPSATEMSTSNMLPGSPPVVLYNPAGAKIQVLLARNKRLRSLLLFDARQMMVSAMCVVDWWGVVWSYLLE
jgi:hypothetical protein